MLIPIKHENMTARRWPVITIALIAINVVVFLFTMSAINDDAPELGEVKSRVLILAALHPELKMQTASQHLVDGFKQSHPEQWKQVQNPNRDIIDAYDAKDGKRLKLLFQTSINAPRQKNQAIVKQACQKAGIDMELKSVTASVFFSSDVANPDTYPHFYCDIEMYTTTMAQPDPAQFLNQFVSWEVATKENKWQGRNITRWVNEEADKAYKAADTELDPIKRAALYIKVNDLACGDQAVIPVVYRPRVSAIGSKLRAQVSGWDSDFGNLKDWYKDA